MATPMNPMDPEIPTNPVNPTNPATPANDALRQTPGQPLGQRPGLVTFAAVMMFVLAGFQIVFAIEEFASAAWVAANVYGMFGGPLWIWGIIDTALALLALYAGYDLLRGGSFGRIFGLIIASFSAIRWFFYLPVAPLLAMVVIAVDVLIIYGLAAHTEYFNAAEAGRRRATV
jgi:hypothetical protein